MAQKEVLFAAGENGYHAYRIPVIAITNKNTVLAFSEARKDSSHDYATIDLVMKRKPQNGSFSESVIVSPKENTAFTYHNLCVIIDGEEIHLIYGKDYLEMFHIVSTDDGLTFSKPEEISYAIRNKKELVPYAAVASGPSGAIVMNNGRYLVPCWISKGSENYQHDYANVFVLFSDDKGKTWKATDRLTEDELNAGECAIANLPNGQVILNFRNSHPCHRRAYMISDDGENWSKPAFDEALNEQVCMAGFIGTIHQEKYYYFFCNPDYREDYTFFENRKKLTLKISKDGCKTWKDVCVIEEGFSGYSDIDVREGNFVALYEQANVYGEPYSLVYLEEDVNNFLKENE